MSRALRRQRLALGLTKREFARRLVPASKNFRGAHKEWHRSITPELEALLNTDRMGYVSERPITPTDKSWGLAEFIVRHVPPNAVVVETGRNLGVSTAVFAEMCRDCRIISIELYPRPEATARLAKYAHVELRNICTYEAPAAFADHSIDVLYIDGPHEYRQVMEELRAWFSKVKPTGVIAGHDYHYLWASEIRAVTDFFGCPPHYVYRDSSWAYNLAEL